MARERNFSPAYYQERQRSSSYLLTAVGNLLDNTPVVKQAVRGIRRVQRRSGKYPPVACFFADDGETVVCRYKD